MPSLNSLFIVLCGAATAAAHGFVNNIIVNSVSYQGYDVTSFPYQDDPPVVVGWSTSATDLGFVAPDAYASGDIICHRDGANAGGHAQVAAGDKIFLQWNTWPESHHGPVLDYLASCGDSGCESVDKTTLEFFKIDAVGLEDGSEAPGLYGTDDLIANGNGWMVEIPSSIKPGFYVLRHEIIALHSAGNEDGAQNYPQCFNLEITGSGTEVPDGVLGTKLYTSDEDGILFNIYTTLDSYPIPGPTLIADATSLKQSASTATVTSSATTGTAKADPTAASTTAETTAASTQASSAASTSADAAASSAGGVFIQSTTSTSSAAPTETVVGCPAKKKKSKKHRRHSRDVASGNVVAIRE